MNKLQIYTTFRNVPTFEGGFPSDHLSFHPMPGHFKYTVIGNSDVLTEPGSQWFAVHFDTRSSSGYYFNSYGLFPLVLVIHILQRNCIMWCCNTRTLRGFTTVLCGQYVCVFKLCMALGLSPYEFVELFGTVKSDLQLETAFLTVFGGRRQGATNAASEAVIAAPAGKLCINQSRE